MAEPDAPRPEITRFLAALQGGEHPAAESELMPVVYAKLREIALGCMRGRRAEHTLHPTALVNEAFVKLFGHAGPGWNDRRHFQAVAARAMRNLLVDHARAHGLRGRRVDGGPITLDVAVTDAAEFDVDLLDLDEALTELGLLDPGQARVVELRYFAGLKMSDVADSLDISLSSAEREWRAARAWLGARLGKAG
jgi:RNA polymerase sigma factor (TIGR02999 family)